jgi:hypothetical protein
MLKSEIGDNPRCGGAMIGLSVLFRNPSIPVASTLDSNDDEFWQHLDGAEFMVVIPGELGVNLLPGYQEVLTDQRNHS